MKLLTRLAAAALTVATFTAPATVGTAHAVQVPAPTAIITHTSAGSFDQSSVTMKAGTLLAIVNNAGGTFQYRVVPTGTTTPSIANGGVGTLAVGQVEQINLAGTPNYTLQAWKPGDTTPSATARIVAL
jgi:hypothetical protein